MLWTFFCFVTCRRARCVLNVSWTVEGCEVAARPRKPNLVLEKSRWPKVQAPLGSPKCTKSRWSG